jgi:hypothetical protein
MKTFDDIREQLRELPDSEKLLIVDDLLMQLDHPDPELDRVWEEEVVRRRRAYREGNAQTLSFEQVMGIGKD